MTVDPSSMPYRRGVGLCLFNAEGLVLMAERRDRPGAWQMPQGGLNKGEDLIAGAFREMKEEIGTDQADIIAKHPEKLRYEFPEWLQYRGGVFRGRYRGQEQDWFALIFRGKDEDIDLSGAIAPELPEFMAWKWTPLMDTPSMIVEFKRPLYGQMVEGFKHLPDLIKAGKLPVLSSDV